MSTVWKARVMPAMMKLLSMSSAALISGTPGTMKRAQATMGCMGVAEWTTLCESVAKEVATKAAMAMPA